MDGSKKITGIVFAVIISLIITACKVHSPGYVGLYVDNIMSVSDTTLAQLVDTTSVEMSFDSVYQSEVGNSLLDLQRNQTIELQNRLTVKPDTSFTEERSKIFLPLTSQQIELDYRKQIQLKSDSIVVLRKQLNQQQNFGTIKVDTVYVIRETTKSPVTKSQQTDQLNRELISAKNEQIQLLQNQLNAMQNTSTPRQSLITMQPPMSSQQTDPLILHQLRVQNDTIQFLKSQLRILQAQHLQGDSVYTEKEAQDMQFAKEVTSEQEAFDLQPLQDTIQLLMTRVLRLEEQALQGKDTSSYAGQSEKSTPYTAKIDTTLLVAFYAKGEIKPLGEESVLKQIKELCNTKNVTKIMLSGYTDSSGNEKINREITNKRLNYLSDKTVQWISKQKIYFQNFGDAFASDTMVSAERRVEIRILINAVNRLGETQE